MTNIDNSIIVLYLVFTVVIGILAGKSVKTVSDFSVGNRNFLTVTLIMTIFATFMDGEVIFNGVTQGYIGGISFFFIICGGPISLVLYSFIATRVTKNFPNAISNGDMMSEIYGPKSQIITGVSSVLMSTAIVALQFQALSWVFDYFYKFEHDQGLIISAAILLTYSVFGGVKAVTWTDVIQFIILFSAIPLVTSVAINNIGGLNVLFEALPPVKKELFQYDQPTLFRYLGYFIAISIPLCSPPTIQRMLMSKNAEQTKKAYLYSAIVSIPFLAVITLAGMAVYYVDNNIDSNKAFLVLVDKYMPVGLKGFAVAGIIAIIMSSADSFMNTASISFSHDILKTILGKNLKDSHELMLTKLITVFITVFAYFLATKFDNIMDMMMYSFNLWGPVISIPLLFGIFGYKIVQRGFYLGIIAGVFSSFYWSLADLEKSTYIDPLIPGLFFHFATFVTFLMIYGNQMKNRKASHSM